MEPKIAQVHPAEDIVNTTERAKHTHTTKTVFITQTRYFFEEYFFVQECNTFWIVQFSLY